MLTVPTTHICSWNTIYVWWYSPGADLSIKGAASGNLGTMQTPRSLWESTPKYPCRLHEQCRIVRCTCYMRVIYHMDGDQGGLLLLPVNREYEEYEEYEDEEEEEGKKQANFGTEKGKWKKSINKRQSKNPLAQNEVEKKRRKLSNVKFTYKTNWCINSSRFVLWRDPEETHSAT